MFVPQKIITFNLLVVFLSSWVKRIEWLFPPRKMGGGRVVFGHIAKVITLMSENIFLTNI